MGLLDTLLGAISGSPQNAANADPNQAPPGAHPGLAGAVIGMLTNRSSGGLSGILDKLKSGGLGTQAASWVGGGPNQPVSPDQVQSALGADQIAQLAQKFGLPAGVVSSHLAQLLPELINHATPDGQVPQEHGAVESTLAALKARVLGHA